MVEAVVVARASSRDESSCWAGLKRRSLTIQSLEVPSSFAIHLHVYLLTVELSILNVIGFVPTWMTSRHSG